MTTEKEKAELERLSAWKLRAKFYLRLLISKADEKAKKEIRQLLEK